MAKVTESQWSEGVAVSSAEQTGRSVSRVTGWRQRVREAVNSGSSAAASWAAGWQKEISQVSRVPRPLHRWRVKREDKDIDNDKCWLNPSLRIIKIYSHLSKNTYTDLNVWVRLISFFKDLSMPAYNYTGYHLCRQQVFKMQTELILHNSWQRATLENWIYEKFPFTQKKWTLSNWLKF